LFQSDTELIDFFQWVLRETEDSRLILNGDSFDFLAPSSSDMPARAFNVEQAHIQIADIIKKHRQVFHVLGELVQSQAHRVAIAAGNHDPELALPAVQEQVEKELLGQHTSTRITWSVYGIAARAQVGAAQVLIEHGDQYDPWNRINHDSVRQTVSMCSKGIAWDNVFTTPAGSELVIEHLNGLRKSYPWIDLLKPDVEAVLPIILEMTSLKEKISHREIVRLRLQSLAQSAVMAAWRKFKPEKLFRAAKRDQFQEYLDSIDPQRQPREGYSRGSYQKIIRRLKKVSQEATFFNIAAPDEPPEVEILLMQGVDAVIHGHTHAAKAYGVGSGLYLNSGTWTQLLRLPANSNEGTWRDFLRSLEQHTFSSETRPTFVRVQQAEDGDEAAIASLYLWQGEPVLWSQWRFSPKTQLWRETYRAPEHREGAP
jgi:UDP-2,3-diacylglucosamine pyrophosphatase LpxH